MTKHTRRPLRNVLHAVKGDIQQKKQVPLGHLMGHDHDDLLRLLRLGRLDIGGPALSEPTHTRLIKHKLSRKTARPPTEQYHLLRMNGRMATRLRKMHRLAEDADEPPPLELQVKVVSKSRKGISKFRSSLHDPLKSFSVSGKERARGWKVEARFELSHGKVEYRVTLHVPLDTMRSQLQRVAWPENEDLTFSDPRYVLCSRTQIFLTGDGGLRAGSNFVIDVAFGPRLRAATLAPGGVTLVGLFTPREDDQPDVRLTSYPFTLAMADARVEKASLHMYSELSDGGGRNYFADLRGALKVGNHSLPVWSDLPADDEVLCWQSQLDEPVELPLAELDPLMGGSGWRTRIPHLQTLLSNLGGKTWLVEAGLGVDLLDLASTDAHAIFEIADFTFLDGALVFRGVRLEWEWSHVSGVGLFQIQAQLEFCGLTFNALLRPPDLAVFASLEGQDSSRDQSLQGVAEGHDPEELSALPPMAPMLRVFEHVGERLIPLQADASIPLEEYDELHLYYCWRTNRLRLRATAVLEDDTLVEANWTVR